MQPPIGTLMMVSDMPYHKLYAQLVGQQAYARVLETQVLKGQPHICPIVLASV